MTPNKSLITIDDNLNRITEFLYEVIIAPRANMLKWSKITNQTPNLKVGYTAQHLASLITGIKGTATGARGEDLSDKTEVKACSRIDPLDKCKNCESNVLRFQSVCPNCGSNKIKRTNDSKWLISIRKEDELKLYLEEIPRMLFIILDYPNFDSGDFDTMRISAYEIWNQSDRAKNFRTLLRDYYYNIYKKHIEINPNKTPAPKDFWPYSYQFYMCNPIKTFECIINDVNCYSPNLTITHYIKPDADRSSITSELMPINLLKENELNIIRDNFKLSHDEKFISEEQRKLLSLRDTSKAQPQKSQYHRGK